METKVVDNDVQDETPSSPYQVLQHFSEEAMRVAGGALQSVYAARPSNRLPQESGHRRSRSEILTSFHRRSDSLQRLKSQMQRALRWGNSSREENWPSSFNPEILADQKRQWYQLQSKTMFPKELKEKKSLMLVEEEKKLEDCKKYNEPTTLFEHFIVAGLHPNVNLETVEAAYATRKKWEIEMEKSEMIDFRMLQHRGPSLPIMEPQILFKYPPGKKVALRMKDLAAFCFPDGVKARVLERTPSLSELNELVYGQEHLSRDDLAFVFSLKVADNATLYGVCLHVQEFVQRPPAIIGASSPIYQSSAVCNRFLVSAPRCYCVLTRVPFFELHFEMLNSIIAQERLNRITQFVTEMTLVDHVPSSLKFNDQMSGSTDSPYRECSTDWMASAIPVDSVIALTAAAAGIISDDEVRSSSSRWEPFSPGSATASEASDYSQARDWDKDSRKYLHYFNDCVSDAPEYRTDGIERTSGVYENGQTLEGGSYSSPRNHALERVGSSESLFSSVRSMISEEEEDGFSFSHEKDIGDEMIMEWARENKNDLLQIVCSYHSMPLPPRGSEIVYQPLEHLQAFEYRRPPVSALGVNEKHVNIHTRDPKESAKLKLRLAAAEEAAALSIWTTATICRVLSLESFLALLAGVLLEKQVVVVCPNLGILSAVVLSLIPIIRPFEWQSLFVPILPGKMFDFLDAPVPFIVGIQHKPSDLKIKTSNLVHVNVVKNQVKMCRLPGLPRRRELIAELAPIHARLSRESSIAERHPVNKCTEVQAEAAEQFLTVMRHYMEFLCSELRSYTITSVQSNNDRVSILLKDSFIESFSSKDQPFIKMFVDTQLFSVLSDSHLSSCENEV